MSKATSNYFSQNKTRPFVITRSTYSGVGKYVSHWLGDNFSNYDMLKYSVGGVFLFNMFGVPVAGADICGFIGDTNPDLCARWYALGAFYPFARNHNDKNSIPQEPFVSMFSQRTISGTRDVTYTDFIREASLKRYALHRYQYSNIHKSSVDGTPYFTPLFYKYSDDPEAYKRVEHNIMLGDSVKISPMVDSGTAVTFYFPEKGAVWCPIWPKYQKKCFPGQSSQAVLLPHDEIFAHLKSGSIIPLQLGDLSVVQENINLAELKDVSISNCQFLISFLGCN
jgi:alpha-glucosidase (family GH31 glycosyl hydrolase)